MNVKGRLTDQSCSLFKVSQGGSTEELADQVSTKTPAAHRWLEEASSHPHEKEKDEAHKSSKGHVSGKYGYMCMSEYHLPAKPRGPVVQLYLSYHEGQTGEYDYFK